MWEFTAHKFVQPTHWTWARIGANGRTIQKSPAAYQSLGSALRNAMDYGFDGNKHQIHLVELDRPARMSA